MVVMVHSPHRDKKRGIRRSLDIARELRLPDAKLVIDHNNEETVEDTLTAGAWAAFTIYPHTKMGSERMVEIVSKYGPERVIVDSSADWGRQRSRSPCRAPRA
jgi:predicted metal-dependent TIM-barrel fold hydrolase